MPQDPQERPLAGRDLPPKKARQPEATEVLRQFKVLTLRDVFTGH